jgi:hypothetical protein
MKRSYAQGWSFVRRANSKSLFSSVGLLLFCENVFKRGVALTLWGKKRSATTGCAKNAEPISELY